MIKFKKKHVDWQRFLCTTPANDYIFQDESYENQILKAAEFIKTADAIIIGAGAGVGVSCAAIGIGGDLAKVVDDIEEVL